MPAGRPTDYRDEYCEQLIDHMAEGFSFESFAGLIDVCKDTLYEWVKVHNEFSDAKKRAFEKNRLFWEKQGIKGLFNTTVYDDAGKAMKSESINPTIWIFNMKNRFPAEWRDKTETEHSGGMNMTWHEEKTYEADQKANAGS